MMFFGRKCHSDTNPVRVPAVTCSSSALIVERHRLEEALLARKDLRAIDGGEPVSDRGRTLVSQLSELREEGRWPESLLDSVLRAFVALPEGAVALDPFFVARDLAASNPEMVRTAISLHKHLSTRCNS